MRQLPDMGPQDPTHTRRPSQGDFLGKLTAAHPQPPLGFDGADPTAYGVTVMVPTIRGWMVQ